MALTVDSGLREVSGIDAQQYAEIVAFMRGAIYCWTKNRKDEAFAVRDLVGGENGNWTGTPLEALYLKHRNQGKSPEDAAKSAGQDLGWIVKSILHSERRTYEVLSSGLVKAYRLTEDC